MAKVAYDPDLHSLTVTLPDATVLRLEGREPFEFVATPGIDEEQPAVFLSRSEITTLGKMLDYVLEKMKITEQSRTDLDAIRAKLGAPPTRQEGE